MKTAAAWIIVVLFIGAGVWYYVSMGPRESVMQEETQTSEEEVMAEPTLVGSWRSEQDAKFTRTFTASGSVTDSYEGIESATITGTWEIITADELPPIGLPQVDGTIVAIQFPEEALYYSATLSDDTLLMTYLSGNGVLMFKRI
ncbi:hypothetical protein KKH81_03630 [Patescibacteria group bacterium]|nr:hypothetical protein [Patescibacteria group bacterium]